jgi:hypothetical protein
MERSYFRNLGVRVLIIWMAFLFLPTLIHAQSGQRQSSLPPIPAPLVREGDLAMKLVPALGMGTASDEVMAESVLGDAGIAPRNGWISDYPVTPDIIGELQKSIGSAVDAGKLVMNKDEALRLLNDAATDASLPVTPYEADTQATLPQYTAAYPDPSAMDDYYAAEGPPVYTYYPPPVDYSYLYGFVPYPFWYSGFWFPGFFILHDFHRPLFVNGRSFYCSNHFRSFGNNRYARINPVGRFNGLPFAHTGPAARVGTVTGASIHSSNRATFNATRANAIGPSRMSAPSRSGAVAGSPYRGRTVSYQGGAPNLSYRSAGTQSVYRGPAAASPPYRFSSAASPSFGHGAYGPSYRSAGFSAGRGSSGFSGGGGGGFSSGRASGGSSSGRSGGGSSRGSHGHR